MVTARFLGGWWRWERYLASRAGKPIFFCFFLAGWVQLPTTRCTGEPRKCCLQTLKGFGENLGDVYSVRGMGVILRRSVRGIPVLKDHQAGKKSVQSQMGVLGTACRAVSRHISRSGSTLSSISPCPLPSLRLSPTLFSLCNQYKAICIYM